jgi:hypothetical protein
MRGLGRLAIVDFIGETVTRELIFVLQIARA